jgi:hypothetical protein
MENNQSKELTAEDYPVCWKSNHDNMVKLNKILRDRPDLGDRAKSMVELIDKNKHLLDMLKEVADYYRGKGQYNFSHLKEYDRDNAAFDAWQDLITRIDHTLHNESNSKNA